MSSQESVRRLAIDFKTRHGKLHLLINNAGVYLTKPITTVDGLESTFAINHLGPFLLTSLLLDVLKASASSRIVNVSSDAHNAAKVEFEDLQGEKKVLRLACLWPVKTGNDTFHSRAGEEA